MTEERSAKYGWWVTIITSLTSFGIYASVTAYSVAAPNIAASLNITNAGASLGTSVFLLGLALAFIVSGMIVDRIGIKNTVLVGMLILIVPQFIIPSVTDFATLMVLRFIQGWCMISASAFLVSITSWIPLKNKGLAASLFLGGSMGGSGIGGLITGYLIPSTGWAVPFYVLGIIPLIFLAIWMATVKVPPSMRAASIVEMKTVQRPRPNYGQLLRMPETWALAGIITANMWLYFGMSGVTAQYGSYLGFSTSDVGALTFSFTPACLAGALVAGYWSDRRAKTATSPIRGRAFVLLIGLSLAMVGTIFIPILGPMGLVPFAAIFTTVMFFNNMAQGAYWAIPSETYPQELQATGSTFSCGIGSLPKPLAPLMIGVILFPLWNIAWWTTTIVSVLGIAGCLVLTRSKIGVKEGVVESEPIMASPIEPANGR